jgi:biopolymer transport protein ExbB
MTVTLAKFFSAGGLFMWLILLLLAVAVAVMIERAIFYLVVCRRKTGTTVVAVAEALEAGNLDNADKAARGNAPFERLMQALLKRYRAGLTYKDIKQGVEEAAIRELPRLTQRLNYLSLFANIATLTGLMGTLFGLQKSFSSLGSVEAAQKTALLATGISEAMNTTAFGLFVAVPCMIAYTVLTNMETARMEDLDEGLVRILNFIQQKRP